MKERKSRSIYEMDAWSDIAPPPSRPDPELDVPDPRRIKAELAIIAAKNAKIERQRAFMWGSITWTIVGLVAMFFYWVLSHLPPCGG